MDIIELIKRGAATGRLNKNELIRILTSDEAENFLARTADKVRQKYIGDGIHLRGLIEFSNICRRNCLYCGLRRDNKKILRFRLTTDEIFALAQKAKNYGYRTVVLQSGEDSFFTAERLAPLLTKIKKLDLAITLSIGERSREEYGILREAGADRFLLRLETGDAELYHRYDPGMSHAERLRCLHDLKVLGYEVGTGTLIGLPGQSIESIANDILLYQAMDADMLGIGPLIPNGDTPLKDAPPGNFHLTRRMISLLRLLIPTANIPATTAVETLKPGGREIMLASGANVIMPNVTEGAARQNYALYPGKAGVADSPETFRQSLTKKIEKLGRYVADDKGFRRK